jgi:hypothetical protein
MASSLSEKLRSCGVEFIAIISDPADQLARLLPRNVMLAGKIIDFVWLDICDCSPVRGARLPLAFRHRASQAAVAISNARILPATFDSAKAAKTAGSCKAAEQRTLWDRPTLS